MPTKLPPAISILLPFYQAAGTLEAAISSILRQSFGDWELLLIDNNADSATAAIARQYQLLDSRIKVIEEPQQGIAFALNKGLQEAKAPFIARQDADDLSHPERLEKQLQYLKEHPAIGVLSCCCHFASSLKKAAGYAHFVQWQNSILSPEDHFKNRFVESPVAHPSIMFRKELIDRWGGYSTKAVPEDYELWLRWMSKGVHFAKLPDSLLHWQDHPLRLSRTHPHYSTSAFLEVKMLYLAQWLRHQALDRRKIIICGASPEIRAKASVLTQEGVSIWGYTDVKERKLNSSRFIPISQLENDPEYFFINLISKRGVGQQIRQLLQGLGFIEEIDFVLAG